MIPTREQIEGDWIDPVYSPNTVVLGWLRAMRDEIDRLTAELALVTKERDTCRVALVDIGTQVGAAVSDKCSTGFLHNVRYEVQLFLAKLTAELASLKPSEDREAKIEAWKKEALTVESDEGIFGQGYFILRRSEITAAVALMRSAGDPDAKLRELRAWMVDKARMHVREGHGWSFETGHINVASVVVRIDELLEQPAPLKAEGSFAFLESDPNLYDPKPAAAVPDDTRELVAQLADVVASIWDVQAGLTNGNPVAIAAKLRGGA